MTVPPELDVPKYGVVFSPAGTAVAYGGGPEGEQVRCSRESEREGVQERVRPGFQARRRCLGIRRRDGWHARGIVLLDGPDFAREQVLARGDLGYDLAFSPDGSRLAYVVSEGDRRHVVVGGKKGPDFVDIKRLMFSPDGRLMYVARDYAPRNLRGGHAGYLRQRGQEEGRQVGALNLLSRHQREEAGGHILLR